MPYPASRLRFHSGRGRAQGKQQARATAAIPTEDGLYLSSDTPLESNYIYKLDRQGSLSQLAPSEVNRNRHVRVYGSGIGAQNWQPLLSWQKDRWPMGLFQYGNAFLPDGINTTSFLALTTVAVQSDDMVTSLYSVAP